MNDLAVLLRRRLAEVRPHHRPTPEYSSGAVALILYPIEGEIHVPMMERPATMPQHAGQISFPGGGLRAGETGLACALREAEEELGIPGDAVEVVGSLGHFPIPVSGWDVEAHVGVWRQGGVLIPDPTEVVREVTVPLADLVEQHARDFAGRRYGPREYPTYREPTGDGEIWGATARMLHYFIETIYRPATH